MQFLYNTRDYKQVMSDSSIPFLLVDVRCNLVIIATYFFFLSSVFVIQAATISKAD